MPLRARAAPGELQGGRDEAPRNASVRGVLQVHGQGGIIGIGLWEGSIFSDLKTNYNSDLNRYIYDGKKTGASEKKNPGLGLKLALDF
mgnify:CR=1 FL=1